MVFRCNISAVLSLAIAAAIVGSAFDADAHPSVAEQVDYPFVVGFERFYASDDDEEYLAKGGLLLLNELNCVGCHAPPESLKDTLSGRPGSHLHDLAGRLSPTDTELWIRNPRFIKNGTLMPSLFAGPDRDLEEIAALKHYLLSLKKPQAEQSDAPEIPQGNVDEGQRLFHRIGCIACHAPANDYRPEHIEEGVELELVGLPSVPLALAERYPLEALAKFLLDPAAHRPAGRMPDMKLSPGEAADLALYLKSGPKDEIPEELQEAMKSIDGTSGADGEFVLDPALVDRGQALFAEKNCLSCHGSVQPEVKPKAAKPLVELRAEGGHGCLSEKPVGNAMPWYYLDEVQRNAIVLALKKLPELEAQPHDTFERIDFTLTAMNCYACHDRDGKGGPELAREVYFDFNATGAQSLGRWGNLPPPLDKVGRKLTREWIEKIVTAHGGEVRPYVAVRMPRFEKAQVEKLLADFAVADVREPPVEIDVSGLPKHQRGHIGRDLMGVSAGGLGCVTCHGLKDAKSLGAPVINLTHTIERLQPAYFKELLLEPQETQPGTLMPPMFAGRKRADQEVEQIWTYLKELDQRRLPDGLLKADNFELKPGEEGKAITFRTFVEGVGSHAVAVGYPQGLNVGFDSETCRWRIAWQGRFIDAMSTWDDRFCSPAKPLGEKVVELAWKLPAEGEVEFLGFKLDPKTAAPTFMYQVGGQRYEDRAVPDGTTKLKRTVTDANGKVVIEEEQTW